MTQWILTSSVLIILVLAVRGWFRKRMKAKAVYALWLIVLVRLLCPVNFGELSFNLLSLAEEGKAQVEERLAEQPAAQLTEQTDKAEQVFSGMVHTLPDTAMVSYASVTDGARETEPVEAENIGFTFPKMSWQQVLTVVWIAGAIVVALIILSVNISFSTTLGMFRKELPLLAKKGRGKKELSVYVADGIYSSCLYGVVRPSIYLNQDEMNEQEKTYCVEHEYSHYLQGDMVWSLCRTLCLILHWYNPLVWVAVMLSKKDAELACDERTIERLGEEERFSYGHTLVELAADQSRAVQIFGMATLMASDKKEVIERVKAIAIKKETKIITGLLVAVLIVCMGFFVFTGKARAEQENHTEEVAQTTLTPVPEKEEAPAATETPLATETPELTPTKAPKASSEKVYEDTEFTDHVYLGLSPEQGWNIDFNGDGIKEQLYIDGFTVYLNGKQQRIKEAPIAKYWLLNIDTTDSMYELLCGTGDMYIYNGDRLVEVDGIKEWTTSSVFFETDKGECVPVTEADVKKYPEIFFIDSDGVINAHCLGDLGEFTRIDEHTICFRDCFCIGGSFNATARYTLDEKHNLQMIPMEYEIESLYDTVEKIWAVTGTNGNNTVKLYSDRDLSGSYTEEQELYDVTMLKSDCVEWLYIETADGIKGWLYDGAEEEWFLDDVADRETTN